MKGAEQELVDDFVLGGDSGENKVAVLIHDLLVAEAWKENIYPHLASHFASNNNLKAYMAVYHEATLANLLEVITFHRSACEEADDALVELIDYCCRKFVWLINVGEK